MASWSPSSWRALPKHQMAEWEDKALAEKVLTKLGASTAMMWQASAEEKSKKKLGCV